MQVQPPCCSVAPEGAHVVNCILPSAEALGYRLPSRFRGTRSVPVRTAQPILTIAAKPRIKQRLGQELMAKSHPLLAIQFDDQLLVDWQVDVFALRQRQHAALG